MSADPMAKPPPPGSTRARMLETEEDKRAWHEMAERSAAARMQQCFWWADPLKPAGVRTNGIGIWKDDRLVSGGLFRSIPIPYVGAHMTQCLAGPIHLHWDAEWAEHFVAKLEELAQADNSAEVAIHGCTSPAARRDIAEAFHRRGLKTVAAPGDTDAVLPLEGATPDALLKGMNEATRRKVRKAQKNAIVVRELRSPSELRGAYDAWIATAKRKDFSDVRPWHLLEPVVRYCVDNGRGAVYGSFLGDRILAAIFVTFIGAQASYVYGGFVDGSEPYCPNHVLHFEAMRSSLKQGMSSYNFGKLTLSEGSTQSGTDQFKLGFRAIPQRREDSIIWRRRPVLIGCIDWVRRQSVGKRLAMEIKERMLGGPHRRESLEGAAARAVRAAGSPPAAGGSLFHRLRSGLI